MHTTTYNPNYFRLPSFSEADQGYAGNTLHQSCQIRPNSISLETIHPEVQQNFEQISLRRSAPPFSKVSLRIPSWRLVEDSYVKYRIETTFLTEKGQEYFCVFRRFNEFYYLHEHLSRTYEDAPGGFPRKSWSAMSFFSRQVQDTGSIEPRRKKLETWLSAVIHNQTLREDDHVSYFLQTKELPREDRRRLAAFLGTPDLLDDCSPANHTICPHVRAACDANHLSCESEITNEDNTQLCKFCPIYMAMRSKKEYSQSNYEHMTMYDHGTLPGCRHGRECKVYQRCEKNSDDGFADLSHMTVFHHPSRRRFDHLPHGFCPVIIQDERGFDGYERVEWRTSLVSAFNRMGEIMSFAEEKQNVDGIRCDWHSNFDLVCLLCEVILNGFALDLVLGSNDLSDDEQILKQTELLSYAQQVLDEIKSMDTSTDWTMKGMWTDTYRARLWRYFRFEFVLDESLITIMEVVHQKMRHPRHDAIDDKLTLAQMLSVVLYTSCNCNLDMSASCRDGTAKMKWPFFIYNLSNAIERLSMKNVPTGMLYGGIPNVAFTPHQLDENGSAMGQFASFTSSSRDRRVAEEFRGENGMMLMITPELQNRMNCADVSWISKFPSEKEVVFMSWHQSDVTWKGQLIVQRCCDQYILLT